MTLFKPKFKYFPQFGTHEIFVNSKGEQIGASIALPGGNYQTDVKGQSIAFSVLNEFIYKAWQGPDRRIYKLLPVDVLIDNNMMAGIRKLIEIRFCDAQRSKEYVDAFFKGFKPIEIIVEPEGGTGDGGKKTATVKMVPEDLDGKTHTELMFYGFENGLGDYVKSSMTIEELKEMILEHLYFPPLGDSPEDPTK